jgi:hypothetical protein
MRVCVLRGVCFLSAALLLAGCTDADWTRLTSYDAPSDGAGTAGTIASVYPDAPARPSDPTTMQMCKRTATERMGDTAAQGFDETLQQQVYDKTYADCMTWAARR